jgi:hypothetical protein
MSALVGYYQALAQEALSKAPLNSAQAGLISNEAAEVGQNAAAARGVQAATAAATRASAFKTTQEGGQVAPIAQSEIGLRGAQAGYSGALAKAANAPFDPANLSFEARVKDFNTLGHPYEVPAPAASALGTSSPINTSTYRSIGDGGPQGSATASVAVQPRPQWADDYMQDRQQDAGYSSGTSHVPGQGDGTVDTVPAMLAPGEAVLNKGAAEHMGRGMIAAVNKIGLARMAASSSGAPDAKSGSAKQPKGKPAGHAKGGMVSYAMGIDEVPATAATPETQATQGGLQKREQHHAEGTSRVTDDSSRQPSKNGDGTSAKDRSAALKADPISKNDVIAIHHPSMLVGMQLMAAAQGMPTRQGFARGTAKVTKGRSGGSAQMAPPGGGGALGMSPNMTAAPATTPSPEQIMALLGQQSPQA